MESNEKPIGECSVDFDCISTCVQPYPSLLFRFGTRQNQSFPSELRYRGPIKESLLVRFPVQGSLKPRKPYREAVSLSSTECDSFNRTGRHRLPAILCQVATSTLAQTTGTTGTR